MNTGFSSTAGFLRRTSRSPSLARHKNIRLGLLAVRVVVNEEPAVRRQRRSLCRTNPTSEEVTGRSARLRQAYLVDLERKTAWRRAGVKANPQHSLSIDAKVGEIEGVFAPVAPGDKGPRRNAAYGRWQSASIAGCSADRRRSLGPPAAKALARGRERMTHLRLVETVAAVLALSAVITSHAERPVDTKAKLTAKLASMFTRALRAPRSAFFLFGPRGTGKSTWLRAMFADAFTVNLLPPATALRYERDPTQLRAEILALPRDRWIAVDEVQRVPRLLDEVHFLMEEKGYRKFVLTGSSARRVKRGAANLLAGRAVVRQFFPLTAGETEFSVPVSQLVKFGALPLSVTAPDDDAREDFLRAYVTTYLSEEIKAEGLVRNLGSFSRFLEVAALAAGQRTNVSNIARDAAVSRETARGFFELLVDTLIGHWLPAYRPRAKVKEVAQPKFYWFDPGVLHAAAGGFDQPLPSDWNGVLLEHLVLHELRSQQHYADVKGSLGYWATPSGSEVDFVWWRGERMTAIEVKHAREFRPSHRKGLESLLASTHAKSYIVYLGSRELNVEGTRVLPLERFLRLLHEGEVLG